MRVDARRSRAWLLLAAILAAVTATTYILLHRRYGLFSWTVGDASSTAAGHASITQSDATSNSNFALHPEHAYRPPRKISLYWTVTKGQSRPDGVNKAVYLINGHFIGPTVEARQGDEISIAVLNALPGNESTAIHWHGLHVDNTMDGVPDVTQCGIPPGKTFVYCLQISTEQAGTFWYHAHSETQRADGLYGAFIIHGAADTASAKSEDGMEDQVLMIGDWYHRTGTEVLDYYTDWKHWKVEPSGDSMLLNGQGQFNCSMAVPARPLDCVPVSLPPIRVGGTRTRLRLINTGSLAGITVTITGYSMHLLEVDGGGAVTSGESVGSIGILYPGERVDVLLERVTVTNSSLTVTLDPESLKWPNLALTAEQHFSIMTEELSTDPSSHSKSTETLSLKLSEQDLTALGGAELMANNMSAVANHTMVLYSTISYLARFENRPKGFINHTSWSMPRTDTPLLAKARNDWPEPPPFIPHVSAGAWVDIVLNNLDDKAHPFHLHGHSFYIISSYKPTRLGAYGAYNPHDETTPPPGGPYNLVNPLRKDTVSVPAMGYVVLRFKANIPGLWMLHCHVSWHQAVGMGMALEVGDEKAWLNSNEEIKNLCCAID